MKLLWIALGGGLGAVLRYVLGGALGARMETHVPLGTVAVNVAGCFLIGLASAWFLAQGSEREGLRLALVVGVLGGFTTFSTFAYETVALLRDGRAQAALTNVVLSNVGGLLACWVGFALFSRVFPAATSS